MMTRAITTTHAATGIITGSGNELRKSSSLMSPVVGLIPVDAASVELLPETEEKTAPCNKKGRKNDRVQCRQARSDVVIVPI